MNTNFTTIGSETLSTLSFSIKLFLLAVLLCLACTTNVYASSTGPGNLSISRPSTSINSSNSNYYIDVNNEIASKVVYGVGWGLTFVSNGLTRIQYLLIDIKAIIFSSINAFFESGLTPQTDPYIRQYITYDSVINLSSVTPGDSVVIYTVSNISTVTTVNYTLPRYWITDYYFDISTMSILSNESMVQGSYMTFFLSKFNELIDYNQAVLSLWLYNYYPRWNSGDTAAWNYYNTDTDMEEPINLGGLMYNISWYLGNLYLLNTNEDYSNNADPTVAALQSKIDELNAAEDTLTEVTGGLSYDNSVFSEIASYGSSITYVSNLMDEIFNSLGILQIVFKLSMTVGLAVYALGSYSEVKVK